MKKLLSKIFAGITAATILTASAFAYDLNTDLGMGWTKSVTVPAYEFESLTADTVITIEFETDPTLEDMEGHSYWVIKPMINDEGWPLISGIKELAPSEDGSSYPVSLGDTSVKFTIPEEFVDHVKLAGVAFMGHGVTLKTITLSNDETIPESTPEESIPEESVNEESVPEGSVNEESADIDSITEESSPEQKPNTDTGVEGVALAIGVFALSGTAVLISKKKN